MKSYLGTVLIAFAVATPAFAQDVDYLQLAIDSGVCGEAGVASATYNAELNVVEAVCNDAEGFLPLVGGLGPVAAGGFAFVVAASGGGNGPSDTQ